MNSKQRAYLKSLATRESAIMQIGKGGTSENLVKQVDDALEARELIKISVLETAPDGARTFAGEIAEATKSEVVQVIGNKIVLFRARKENSKIILP